MYIKKMFQGEIPENKVVNGYSTSQTDTYSCNYINELNIYSIDEKIIGIWINGKPIYRKVISLGYLPNNATKDIPYNIDNLDMFIDIRGIGYRSSDNVTNPIPSAHAANLGNNIGIYSSNDVIIVRTGSDRSNMYGYAILEYTKTTDIATIDISTFEFLNEENNFSLKDTEEELY